MARPKNEKTVLVTAEQNEVTNPVALENKAFSVVKDLATNKWLVVSISYDLDSGQTGKLERVEENEERHVILERFKTLSGEEFF